MRRFSLFFLILIIFQTVNSQEIRIINKSTFEPVETVTVSNQYYTKSVITDSNGVADLSEFNESDSLFIQHQSYVKKVTSYTKAIKKGTIKLDRKIFLIPETVVSVSKYKENKTDVSQMIDIISKKTIDRIPVQNSADILLQTGNIFVQKTQGGGGSPILRGFEANRVLLVIDGIRMNNAIYRNGHLQNSLTIDNAILERVEIIYGPSSVIYGSDALGGTIHYITKTPKFADKGKTNFDLSSYAQVATGNQSEKFHLDFSVGKNRISSLSSITYSNFGDIRMGSNRSPFLEDFGKCIHYADRINGMDSMVVNSNPNIQKYTGYSQLDVLQKFRIKLSEKNELTLNVQHSNSSDIHRYDNLNDYTSDSILKFSEWYYGPQKRSLFAAKHKYISNSKLLTELNTTLAYQIIEESRHKRKFNSNTRTNQYEHLDVLSASIDFLKRFKDNSFLHYGLDAQFDKLNSTADTTNIISGEKDFTLTRYPDKGSIVWNNSVFTAFKTQLGRKIKASAGIRYNFSLTEFQYVTEHNIDLLDTTYYSKSNHAVTGTLGMVYKLSDYTRFTVNLATGYRNPNLDDMAKIRPKGYDILLPNPNIKPEYTYNGEIGFIKTFDGYIQLSAYYYITYLTNAIVREKLQDEFGNDSIQYEGDMYRKYTNVNAAEAIIQGSSINLISNVNNNLSFRATANYTYGRNIRKNEPLAHIPPINGRADVTYKLKKLAFDFYFLYNGWKVIDDMSTTGEDNEDEGTEFGFPSWYTLNAQLTYLISDKLNLQLTLENITDNFYKPYASGVAAPGFNFTTTLRLSI